MSAQAFTEDGTEVTMHVGDRLVDEFNTTAIEYTGFGKAPWAALWNAGYDERGRPRWRKVTEHFVTHENAREAAAAAWWRNAID